MHMAYISMGELAMYLRHCLCGELKKMGHRVSFFTAEYISPQVKQEIHCADKLSIVLKS